MNLISKFLTWYNLINNAEIKIDTTDVKLKVDIRDAHSRKRGVSMHVSIL